MKNRAAFLERVRLEWYKVHSKINIGCSTGPHWSGSIRIFEKAGHTFFPGGAGITRYGVGQRRGGEARGGTESARASRFRPSYSNQSARFKCGAATYHFQRRFLGSSLVKSLSSYFTLVERIARNLKSFTLGVGRFLTPN
jgi:hypothetical protein